MIDRDADRSAVATPADLPPPAAVAIGVAALYLACAWLGWRMTLSDGLATLFWPAAGAGFGAVVVFGPRAVPGIALAALAAALAPWAVGGADAPLPSGLAAAAAASLAAVAQPLAAREMLRRAGLDANPFADLNALGTLSASLAATCVIGAVGGLAALAALGALPGDRVVVDGLAIWFGNLTGVFVVAPIFVAAARGGWGRACIVALIASTGLGATWTAVMQLRRHAQGAEAELQLGSELAAIGDAILALGIGATALLAHFTAYLLRRNEDIREQVERRTAELAERERELRTALDYMPGAMVLTDADARIRLFSAGVDGLVGFPDGTMASLNTHHELIRRLADQGAYGEEVDADEIVSRRRTRAGDAATTIRVPGDRIVEIRRRPTDEGGLVITGMDVTQQEHAFEEAMSAADRLRDILEQSPVGVLISIDDRSADDGLIVLANGRFLDMIGLARDAVGAARTEQFLPPSPERRIHQAALDRGEAVRNMEARVNRVDGGGLRVLVSILPIDYDDRRCALVWVYDITERKAAEEAIAEAKAAAEAALEDLRRAQERLVTAEKMASLGQLTAGVAHEIKNPLNFINNFAETSVELVEELEEALAPLRAGFDEDARDEIDDLASTLKGDLQKIAGHGRRADGIIKSMLMHARGATGQRREADVNALVEEATGLAYHGERARDGLFKAECRTEPAPDAGRAEIEVEEMTRVLVNIVANALQAVKTRAQEADDGYSPRVVAATRDLGDDVAITVRDNGTGMPEAVRQKIFEPFFTTKPTGEGTGLGLSMCYDIVVHQHGGRLDVESAPGEFTEFRITLPRRAKPAAATGA